MGEMTARQGLEQMRPLKLAFDALWSALDAAVQAEHVVAQRDQRLADINTEIHQLEGQLAAYRTKVDEAILDEQTRLQRELARLTTAHAESLAGFKHARELATEEAEAADRRLASLRDETAMIEAEGKRQRAELEAPLLARRAELEGDLERLRQQILAKSAELETLQAKYRGVVEAAQNLLPR